MNNDPKEFTGWRVHHKDVMSVLNDSQRRTTNATEANEVRHAKRSANMMKYLLERAISKIQKDKS